MKKILLLLILAIVFTTNKLWACADVGYDEDGYEYYGLFMQEIVDDPQYYPFLLSLNYAYYASKEDYKLKNENIEEWQQYLGLSYDDAYYLVFKASKEDVDNLLAGKSVGDSLGFATSSFTSKYKQALLYLSYAKYLEPYMMITSSGSDSWGYYRPEDAVSVDKLNYSKVISVLERSWNAESDKELKLRYGYQLVRFAHYNRKYDEAIRYFDKYVEALNYKPAMYYHALSQKAGAEKGLGDVMKANSDFFQVFVHSKNLKESALTSIKFGDNADFNNFLLNAKTQKEKNDAYLLLGFIAFNNPLNEIEKIVAITPDAVQAKVLMMRAIKFLENDILWRWNYSDKEVINDKRYPIIKNETRKFFDNTLNLAIKMTESSTVKDKDYWEITTAYLLFLDKRFTEAKKYLNLVKKSDDIYSWHKRYLAMYIDICEAPEITSQVETYLFETYNDVFTKSTDSDNDNFYEEFFGYKSKSFIIDVLANRYFLQKDYAKSFFLSHRITDLEYYPQLDMLKYVEDFYHKTNKNGLEKYIEGRMYTDKVKPDNVQNYIYYLRGIVYLTKGDYNKALETFNSKGYQTRDQIPSKIFGYNKIECFECSERQVVASDYLTDFSFIKKQMDEKELAETLLQLQKVGQKSDEQAAEANYLIGNFVYNTTTTGYYRHVLRFDNDNSFCTKYYLSNEKVKDIFTTGISFYNYPMHYDNPVSLSQQYLQKALNTSTNNELKARIVFALSKCEQEMYDEGTGPKYWYNDSDNILIKDRKYFKELVKYQNTYFYKDVVTNCKYFEYYVSHYK